MKQLDLFYDGNLQYKMNLTPKIFESPDRGQTIYEREFGSTERKVIKTSVQQQWTITYNGMKI